MWISEALAQGASQPAGADFLIGILPLVAIFVGVWFLLRWLKKKKGRARLATVRAAEFTRSTNTLAFVGAFFLCLMILAGFTAPGVVWFIVFIAAVWFGVRAWSWYENRIINSALAIAQEHMRTLVRKRNQYLIRDDYGNVQPQKWSKELGYFMGSVIAPRLGGIPDRLKARIGLAIDDQVSAECAKSADDDEPMPLDGAEFEAYCRRILERHGWRVTNTPVTGDQGVDLVGHLGLAVVAIQCKRYSSSVTNKAVQEVIAGRTHYGAHFAVVVSNAPYTKSAIELAKTNAVFLLHPVDLPKLGDTILEALERAA